MFTKQISKRKKRKWFLYTHTHTYKNKRKTLVRESRKESERGGQARMCDVIWSDIKTETAEENESARSVSVVVVVTAAAAAETIQTREERWSIDREKAFFFAGNWKKGAWWKKMEWKQSKHTLVSKQVKINYYSFVLCN